MKTAIKISITLVILFINVLSYSQWSDAAAGRINMTDEFEIYGLIGIIDLNSIDSTSRELVGSSYVNQNFISGNISNKEMVYLMRYNAYKDEMEIELEGKPYYLPKTGYYSINFDILNKEYQLLDYIENKESKKGFFVVLNKNNKTQLLIKEKVKLYKEVPAKLGFTRYEPPKLGRLKDEIYIAKNNEAIELPKKKKDILNFFSHKSKEIELFAKKNKLSFKKSEDLIKIINYYNTLN